MDALKLGPGTGTPCLLTRELGLAVTVLQGVQSDLDFVADGHFQLAVVHLELLDWDHALGLESGIDDHGILADVDDRTVDDGPGLGIDVVFAFFQKLGKTLGHKTTVVSLYANLCLLYQGSDTRYHLDDR